MATYTIKSGDTLGALATANKTDVATLQKLNPTITDPNKIFAGASLNLPDQAVPTTAPTSLGGLNLGASSGVVTSDPVRNAADLAKKTQAEKDQEDQTNLERLTRQKQIQDLQTGLTTGAPPDAPDLVGTYNKLRQDQGVADVETQLTDIKGKKVALANSLKEYEASINGVGSSQGFVDAADAQKRNELQKQMDDLNLQESTLADQLNTKNSTIQTIMTLTGQDYQNSVAQYNTKFNQTMAELNLLRDENKDELDQQQKQQQQQQDNAKATLSVIRDSITSGNLSYDQLDPSQKAQIDKLDLIAYGTTGVTALLKPEEKELDTYTDANGNRVVVFYDPSTKRTRNIVLGTASTGTSTQFTKTQINSGAANAAMSIDDFKTLDADTQNFFVNNASEIDKKRKAIDDAKTNGDDPRVLEQQISESNAPAAVKDTLVRYLKQVFGDYSQSNSNEWWKFW